MADLMAEIVELMKQTIVEPGDLADFAEARLRRAHLLTDTIYLQTVSAHFTFGDALEDEDEWDAILNVPVSMRGGDLP